MRPKKIEILLLICAKTYRQQTTMSGFTTTNRKDYYDILAMDLPEVMVGHFWVVRDGRVIDPKFPEHRQIQRQNRLQDVSCHLPAPEMTQKIMIASHIKKAKNVFGENYAGHFRRIFDDRPYFGMCFFNAVMEQRKNGGEIVFGSMGWLRDDDTEFYEYGGKEFQIVADFTGKTDCYKKACMEELRRDPKFASNFERRREQSFTGVRV